MKLLQGEELARGALPKVSRARLSKVLAGASKMADRGLKAGWEGRWGQKGVNKPGRRKYLRYYRSPLR